MAKETMVIAGVIIAGAAVAGSLFMLYPDLLFQNTGFESQGGAAPDVPVLMDETATAGFGNSTNSTTNATTGPSATTGPPY